MNINDPILLKEDIRYIVKGTFRIWNRGTRGVIKDKWELGGVEVISISLEGGDEIPFATDEQVGVDYERRT